MITIAILQEIADAGSPEAWLRTYYPESGDVPEPCFDGCECRCFSDWMEHLAALELAAIIRAQLPAETVAAIEAEVHATMARVRSDLAMLDAIDAAVAA